MQEYWNITIDEYLEVVELSKQFGITAGQSMEPIFLAYMKLKGKRPFGRGEFTKAELLQQLMEKNGNILDIETDSQGKQTYKIIKKEEN